MKADGYSEIYLWNRDVDRLIRVLQRMDSIGILSKQEMKVYEGRLEEVRAALNAHFSGAMATRDRDDHSRLKRQRTAWENANTKPKRKGIGADVPITATSAPGFLVVHLPLKAQ